MENVLRLLTAWVVLVTPWDGYCARLLSTRGPISVPGSCLHNSHIAPVLSNEKRPPDDTPRPCGAVDGYLDEEECEEDGADKVTPLPCSLAEDLRIACLEVRPFHVSASARRPARGTILRC